MKKINSLLFSAFMMVLLASFSFTSCSKDDDDDNSLAFENKLWAVDDHSEGDEIMKFKGGNMYVFIGFGGKAVAFDFPLMDLSKPVGTYKVNGNKIAVTTTVGDAGSYEMEIVSCDGKTFVAKMDGDTETFNAVNFKEVKFTELSEEEQAKFLEEIDLGMDDKK